MAGRDVVDVARLAKVALDVHKTSEALKTCDFFHELDTRQLAMLSSAGRRRRHARYAALYREGAVAKAFYVLTAGKLEERQVAAGLGDDIGIPPPPGPRILQEKRKGRERRAVVCPRGAGCEYVLFGTEALLGKPRASTMSCSDDVEVLTFNADELHLHLRPDGVAKVRRKLFETMVEAELVHTDLFRDLPSRSVREFVCLLELREVLAGEVLFDLGNPADCVYWVLQVRWPL